MWLGPGGTLLRGHLDFVTRILAESREQRLIEGEETGSLSPRREGRWEGDGVDRALRSH